jgi:diguanylate cyclase (GGDEF)-like protein
MGGEPVTFAWSIVATTLAMGGLAWFGLFRHRGNQLVWASAGAGAGAAADTGGPQDPEIARRIASLTRDDPEPGAVDSAAGAEIDAMPDMELADVPGQVAPDPVARPGAEAGSSEAGASDGDAAVVALEAGATAGVPEPPAAGDRADAPLLPGDPTEMLRRLLVDHVTGLGSRLAWDRWVADEEARERRYRRPTTLVVAEVTGLDAVSAFLGSDAAVRVVTEVADIVRANVRTSDHAALVGPARFAILLPETDEVRAVNFVERVRAACDRWLEANAPTVGIGFGWASPGASGDLAAAREVADRRLATDLRDVATGSSRP